MSVESIARRYAVALADVVSKSGESGAVKLELKEWEVLLKANGDLQDAFGNPSIAYQQKEKLLEALLAKTHPLKTSANFLRVMLRNGRLMDISEINERFAAELDARGGIVSASIISARDLPEGERSELRSNLEKLTGKKVNIEFSTDTNIIGGVVTRVGSTVYDGSVKTQLENLREQLVNG